MGGRHIIGEGGLRMETTPDKYGDFEEFMRSNAGKMKAQFDSLLREAYDLGFKAASEITKGFVEVEEVVRQDEREKAIRQARADITELQYEDESGLYALRQGEEQGVDVEWHFTLSWDACKVEFRVNKEERTIVALLKGATTGRMYSKGIAKCVDGDCFNEDIGKAIALRKALNKSIYMYMNVPNPTEIREGNIVETEAGNLYEILSEETQNRFTVRGICSGLEYKFIPIVDKYKIVDDTVGGLTE